MDCYNCEGQGAVFVKDTPICPDCKRPVTKEKDCGCGSRADLMGQAKVAICPICKGQKSLDL